MSKAIVYVRVSDQKQVDNTSLASQEAICHQWCEANGFTVDRVFIEKGESAKSADRTQFQAMFRYIESKPRGAISAVVVYDSTRFMRDVDYAGVYRIRLREHGAELLSATQKFDDSASGVMHSRMGDVFARVR